MAEPAQRVRRGRGRRPAGEVRAGVLAAAGDLLLTQEGAGPVIAGLIGAAQTDPDLSAAFAREYAGPRRELAVRALEKARDRGELRGDRDLGILVDQLWGAC